MTDQVEQHRNGIRIFDSKQLKRGFQNVCTRHTWIWNIEQTEINKHIFVYFITYSLCASYFITRLFRDSLYWNTMYSLQAKSDRVIFVKLIFYFERRRKATFVWWRHIFFVPCHAHFIASCSALVLWSFIRLYIEIKWYVRIHFIRSIFIRKLAVLKCVYTFHITSRVFLI